MKWWKAFGNIRSRKAIIGIAVGSFVAGLVLLSIGAYSLLESDSSASERTLEAVEVSAVRTAAPTASTSAAPPAVTPVAAPPLGDAPYRFVFEKLDVDAPVETYGLDENAIPVVPTGDNAADIVAWYDFSAQPGMGNAVFAGHVTWYGQAVFYDLKTSAPGDVIKLRGEDGAELTYVVSWVNSVDPSDPESVKVMAPTDPPSDVITIITCDGAFQDTNDPVFGGEYSRRLVVRAERIA